MRATKSVPADLRLAPRPTSLREFRFFLMVTKSGPVSPQPSASLFGSRSLFSLSRRSAREGLGPDARK